MADRHHPQSRCRPHLADTVRRTGKAKTSVWRWWDRFLAEDADAALHVVVDHQSAHKPAAVHAWLKDHPRWTFHFIPTPASRTSAVEGFFSKLARSRLRNAIFNLLDACIAVIKGYIKHHNENNAHPFRWSKEPEGASRIVEKRSSEAAGDGIICLNQTTSNLDA